MLNIFILIPIIFLVYKIYIERKKFNNSQYKNEANLTFLNLLTYWIFNHAKFLGYYGEYQTYLKLEQIPGNSKILTNIYLPKEDDKTTEIDLIFIHETGIYVFESKNYSGWIYGSENSKYWTQTFKTGHKEKFYNPIWQNNTHIKYLKKYLKDIDDKYFKSIIVFSERCTLKNIYTQSKNVKVINRYNLSKLLNKMVKESNTVFTKDEIENIYSRLKDFTCVSNEVKEKHIENIMN